MVAVVPGAETVAEAIPILVVLQAGAFHVRARAQGRAQDQEAGLIILVLAQDLAVAVLFLGLDLDHMTTPHALPDLVRERDLDQGLVTVVDVDARLYVADQGVPIGHL